MRDYFATQTKRMAARILLALAGLFGLASAVHGFTSCSDTIRGSSCTFDQTITKDCCLDGGPEGNVKYTGCSVDRYQKGIGFYFTNARGGTATNLSCSPTSKTCS